jgi:hypothetical protein
MRTIRIFGHEIGLELWTGKLFDFTSWQLAAERDVPTAPFASRLYWFGPLHIAVSRLS